MAAHIHRVAGNAAVIAQETSLTELAALCHRAGFFIGSDTGPLHLATAVGTPCVGLYGTTRPEESGAWGPQHIAIQKWYQSGSCRQRRNASNEAMRDIQVEDVLNGCRMMISRIHEVDCNPSNVA